MATAQQPLPPVFITAPTARNGVTLLQRLLNSSRQIIVYGENQYLMEALPASVHNARGIHEQGGAEIRATRDRFLHETTEFWSSNLWPDTGAYFAQTVQAFQGFLDLYQRCSQEYGFSRWGIKHPLAFPVFARLYALLPGVRYIYVYRDLRDVARSSKARRFVKSRADLDQLINTWCESVRAMQKLRAENLLILRHEDLVQDPDTWIRRISEHTQITNIDPAVMTRKFNTFRGPAEIGCAENEYIAPAELTESETALIETRAGELLAEVGYETTAPVATG